ncbi:hypothetical protein EG878_17490 [Enterococcus faecalis]|nr:hypothetical protein EG878_17490 [Enterococcus faecalis]
MSGEVIERVETFGDVRQLILQTIIQIRDGGLDVQQGMAIAANMKVLNENIQCEINAAKLALLTEGKAHQFGRVVQMGRKLIGNPGDRDV